MTTPNVTVLRDMVMIRPMPLSLKKTAVGIILPGDVDKMAPKRATVIGAGPGVYIKDQFVENPIKVGDQILYMERGLIPTKVEGEEYLLLKSEDVIVKLGKADFEPDDSIPEMSDAVYRTETLRRKLISHLESRGLVRVQDMLNPVETFISSDGETVPATARSFRLESSESIDEYVPPDSDKAFSMYKVNYIEVNSEIIVVARLAFLPRTDVTLG